MATTIGAGAFGFTGDVYRANTYDGSGCIVRAPDLNSILRELARARLGQGCGHCGNPSPGEKCRYCGTECGR